MIKLYPLIKSMSKRKAQFDIAGDLEKEDCLPQIGVINT